MRRCSGPPLPAAWRRCARQNSAPPTAWPPSAAARISPTMPRSFSAILTTGSSISLASPTRRARRQCPAMVGWGPRSDARHILATRALRSPPANRCRGVLTSLLRAISGLLLPTVSGSLFFDTLFRRTNCSETTASKRSQSPRPSRIAAVSEAWRCRVRIRVAFVLNAHEDRQVVSAVERRLDLRRDRAGPS